jgi:hypothetical protein
MDRSRFEHSEAFLQWIWENLMFNINGLTTVCGKSLQIIDQGNLNHTDGPDFTQASIVIDGITWHGDVEIHLQENGWKAHGHHQDRNFNTVILHVVAGKSQGDSRTQNGHRPFTLDLRKHLPLKLNQFLKSFEKPETLNCASGLHYISEDAFYKQLEKAHKEYLEQKANDFLQYYDPNKLPSEAWKHALILSIWDGLGISHNREPMKQAAYKWLAHIQQKNDIPSIRQTLNIAGLQKTQANSSSPWNLKSVRPANHPAKRIRQAARISTAILNTPFDDFLEPSIIQEWERILSNASIKNTGRFQILYGTVFLPSVYILGNLFAYQKLSDEAFTAWKNLRTPVPRSLLQAFGSLPLTNKRYQKKLGAIHQLRAYCKPGKCSECFVLKKAIQS